MKLWHSSKHLHNPLSSPVLLLAVLLSVYYPAMTSGIHIIDDPGIFSFYSASVPLTKILLPGNSYYYRPMTELTFWLDNLLWGMEPSVMHLENVLLHYTNSLLVFLLARNALPADSTEFPLISLAGALLFAVHPANVEAVAWIAGRTDLLLALFVLSASYFWIRWIKEPRWQDMVMALALFSTALLTKESAFAAIPVACLFALTWPGSARMSYRWLTAGSMLAVIFMLLILFLFFRGDLSGLNKVITATDLQYAQGLMHALSALGFYTKKLLAPAPLSFAITEVHPTYSLAGVLVLLALPWMLWTNRRAGVFFVSAMFLILPALAVAVMQISWTPIAERYLYLSTAFSVLGLSAVLSSISIDFRSHFIFFILLLAIGFSVISLQRTRLWHNQLAFIQDSIAKSPKFGSLYNELGGILLKRGELERATEAFLTAEYLNTRPSMRMLIKRNILGVELVKGNNLKVRELFFQTFKVKMDAPADFIELLYKADNRRMHTLSGTDRIALIKDLLETLRLLNEKQFDPFWFYQSGQLALALGDNAKAADFFFRAYTAAPADAPYRKAVIIHLQKLGNQL